MEYKELTAAASAVSRAVERYAPHMEAMSNMAQGEGTRHATYNYSAFGLHGTYKGLVWFIVRREPYGDMEKEIVEQHLSWKTIQRYEESLPA